MLKDNPELAEELEEKIMEALKSGAKSGAKKSKAQSKTTADEAEPTAAQEDTLDFDEELPDDFSIEEDI